jgi:hypothetical protein
MRTSSSRHPKLCGSNLKVIWELEAGALGSLSLMAEWRLQDELTYEFVILSYTNTLLQQISSNHPLTRRHSQSGF